MFVPGDMLDRVAVHQRAAQRAQSHVLRIFEKPPLKALQFDANRVVVALISTAVTRCSRMPGTLLAIDELLQFSGAPYKKVRRDAQAFQLFVVRVRCAVERAEKKR